MKRNTLRITWILCLGVMAWLGCMTDTPQRGAAAEGVGALEEKEETLREKSPRPKRDAEKLAPNATVEDPNSLTPDDYDHPVELPELLPGRSYCYYYRGDSEERSVLVKVDEDGTVVGEGKNVVIDDMDDRMVFDIEIKGEISDGRLRGTELLSMGDYQEKNKLDWKISPETLDINGTVLTKRGCSNPMKGSTEPPVWRK